MHSSTCKGPCNALFSVMVKAAEKHRIDDSICSWIQNMLHKRHIKSTLHVEALEAVATQGCPRGEVLSLTISMDLVVDGLLWHGDGDGASTRRARGRTVGQL